MPGMVLSGNGETALRLGAALLLGAIFGLNRESHGKPAGLRTHALVCLGAAVSTIIVLKSPNSSLAAEQTPSVGSCRAS
jgi:putative Mg2+ transporter-C (MgtC) family protein